MELYIMKSDGSDLRRLTNTPGYDGGPFFRADGKKNMLASLFEDHATAEIYTMNMNGTDEKLTNMKKLSWAPYFHPSGEYLIYATNQHGFANFELYLVRADGKGQPTQVTYKEEGFDGLPTALPLTEKNSHGHQSVPRMAPLRFYFKLESCSRSQGIGCRPKKDIKITPNLKSSRNLKKHKTTAAITAEDLRWHIETLSSDENSRPPDWHKG